ncbi:MAG: riboflavin synthase [Planctomycetaceae bacterium]|nr:riboflavin synthase [Planctomycetaceae bacterium]
MFTGIIRHVGSIKAAVDRSGSRRLSIDIGPLAEGLSIGDSVSVNGACLTASAIAGAVADFDVIAETLGRTGLGRLVAGARVNLERALTLQDGLDGHLVQGHVDGRATVKNVRRGNEWVIEFAAAADVTDQMVPKGSVALDGVSLTLVDVGQGTFSVAIIPTTHKDTTLANLRAGDQVNVEVDLIGKYVRRYLNQIAGGEGGGLSLEKLRKAGFV